MGSASSHGSSGVAPTQMLARDFSAETFTARLGSLARSAQSTEELVDGILEQVMIELNANEGGIYLFDDASVEMPFSGQQNDLQFENELLLFKWNGHLKHPTQIKIGLSPGEALADTQLNINEYFISDAKHSPIELRMTRERELRGLLVVYPSSTKRKDANLYSSILLSLSEACVMIDLITDRFLQRDLLELNEEGLSELGFSPERLLVGMLAKAKTQVGCEGISFFAKDFTDDNSLFHLIATAPKALPKNGIAYSQRDLNLTSLVLAGNKDCVIHYIKCGRKELLGLNDAKWRDIEDEKDALSVMYTFVVQAGEITALLRCTNKSSTSRSYFNALDRRRADVIASFLMIWHVACAKESRFIESLNNVSHELETSASGIRSAVNYIKRRLGAESFARDREQIEYKLRFIGDTAATLINLNPALRINRAASDVPSSQNSVDITEHFRPYADLVMPLVESFQEAARKRGLNINIVGPHQLGLIYHSCDDFRHIFQNLLSNAVKYTNFGKTILVSFERPSTRNSFAKIHVLSESLHIGYGERDDIFRSSYRSRIAIKEQIEGSGLGLAIARGKARQFGGDVVFHQRGEYNVFSILIPRRLFFNQIK
ncbi:MAG: HAMP domain-containing sensor histidine kinase [Chthoniobacteraceae bacterium]